MLEPIRIALGSALAIAVVAAILDWRTAHIPNWLTLPTIAVSPFVYGHAFGLEQAVRCIAAILVSAVVPYFLFRRAAMGGGDVKLFAALGGVTGFDPLAGLEIQLVAFGIGLVFALAGLAWKRSLWRFLWKNLASRPADSGHSCSSGDPTTPATLRMGGAILMATALFAIPYFTNP
ncbi:MAG: A24 family peptidase [Myxococcales bacterium]|jgi:prepilin peptidase CpaA